MKTIIFFFVSFLIFACSNDHNEMSHDSEHQNHEHEIKAAETVESELVREGVIDVESLDNDGDGNLFECPMDWNVISDKSGECPVCGMDLKEFTILEVKNNLDKYGYEYKK
jgi:hypothetical protein